MHEHLLTPRRPSANADDNLIPLINIVFLLLIFFMVAGQIAPQQDTTITPPESTSRKALEPAPLELTLSASGELRADAQSIDAAGLEARINEATKEGRELRVSLRADRDATAADLDQVFNQLRDHGVSTVTLHSLLKETD